MGNNLTEIVKNLLIINVIIFFGTTMLMAPDGTLIPFHWRALALHFPLSDGFMEFQIATHMFMHADPGHLFFNMLGLYFFGPPLEHLWGPKRFLFFYLAAGLGAAFTHIAASFYEYNKAANLFIADGYSIAESTQAAAESIVPALGASGAVYGVFVGFAMLFPNQRVMLLIPPIPMRASVLVMVLIGYDLLLGVSGYGTGIAHFAHLGGAFFGAAMVYYWKNTGRGYS